MVHMFRMVARPPSHQSCCANVMRVPYQHTASLVYSLYGLGVESIAASVL